MNFRANERRKKLTAVLGGGFQGCCIALALAERGVPVHLYDRADDLLTRTAIVNEGKLHLGYVYAGDDSLATARTLMRGALAFAPFLQHHLGVATDWFNLSAPFTYLVHRDSLRSADQIGHYLAAVHSLIREAASHRKDVYFGIDLRSSLRQWVAREITYTYDPALVMSAFDTPEIAIEPAALARRLRECIASTQAIELRTRRTVRCVEENRNGLQVVSDGPEGIGRQNYHQVVNALWDGRLAIDATLNRHPSRPWVHRFKYGIRMRCDDPGPALPTSTIVLGPFGDLVAYRQGEIYLSWYPVCRRGLSQSLAPPDWAMEPPEPLRSAMVRESIDAMAQIIRPVRDLNVRNLVDLSVKGGVIVAWGQNDIDDPTSELHQRYAIGITSKGHYHSVDPGKFTMAPLFATITADRVCAV